MASSDFSFRFVPVAGDLVTFEGRRPLGIAMNWHGPIPELHEQNTAIKTLDLVDRVSPSQSNACIITGKLSITGDAGHDICLPPLTAWK